MANNEIHAILEEIKTLRRDLFYELLDVRNAGRDAAALTAAYSHITEAKREIVRLLQSNN